MFVSFLTNGNNLPDISIRQHGIKNEMFTTKITRKITKNFLFANTIKQMMIDSCNLDRARNLIVKRNKKGNENEFPLAN